MKKQNSFVELTKNISRKFPKEDGDFSKTNIKRSKLVTSIFHIISIEPRCESQGSVQSILEGSNDSDESLSTGHRDLLSKNINNVFTEKNCGMVRPGTPSRVLQMFEKISPGNILVKKLSTYRKDFLKQNHSIEMSNSIQANSYTLSDSDSDILDDDEYEIINQNRYQRTDSLLPRDKIMGTLSGKPMKRIGILNTIIFSKD